MSDSNISKDELKKELFLAVQSGSVSRFQELLPHCRDINERCDDWEGDTLLIQASARGETSIARILLDKKVNVNIADRQGCTALMLAAKHGYTDIVKALIDAGADVDVKNDGHDTALMWAAKRGYTDIVKALIDAGADVDVKECNYHNTALMEAADKGYTEIAMALIDADADVNVENNNGYTALMKAADKGYTEIARALIDAGADTEPLKAMKNAQLFGPTFSVAFFSTIFCLIALATSTVFPIVTLGLGVGAVLLTRGILNRTLKKQYGLSAPVQKKELPPVDNHKALNGNVGVTFEYGGYRLHVYDAEVKNTICTEMEKLETATGMRGGTSSVSPENIVRLRNAFGAVSAAYDSKGLKTPVQDVPFIRAVRETYEEMQAVAVRHNLAPK